MKTKLYFRKMLASIGLLTVVVPSSLTVVSCGNSATESKQDLSSVITNTEVDGNKFNTKEDVLNEIVNLNKDITIDDVELKLFNPSLEGMPGIVQLKAKANVSL